LIEYHKCIATQFNTSFYPKHSRFLPIPKYLLSPSKNDIPSKGRTKRMLEALVGDGGCCPERPKNLLVF